MEWEDKERGEGLVKRDQWGWRGIKKEGEKENDGQRQRRTNTITILQAYGYNERRMNSSNTHWCPKNKNVTDIKQKHINSHRLKEETFVTYHQHHYYYQ